MQLCIVTCGHPLPDLPYQQEQAVVKSGLTSSTGQPLPSSEYLLTYPSSRFRFDLLEPAEEFTTKFGRFLKPPTRGWYLPGDLEPVLDANEDYFARSDRQLAVPLQFPAAFSALNEDIVDKTGRVVVLKTHLQRHSEWLLPKPSVPSRALRILEAIALEYLAVKTFEFRWSRHFSETGLELFRQKFLSEHEFELHKLALEIIPSLRDLVRCLQAFIGRDIYHRYGVGLDYGDLVVFKYADDRVIRWTEQQETRLDEHPWDRDSSLTEPPYSVQSGYVR